MKNSKKYYAFISYKREDEKWARWIQKKLEYYRIPIELRQKNSALPQFLRPIFRDVTDLNGQTLLSSIMAALDTSQYLIVICSPYVRDSIWVNREVQYFIETGREEYIIPVIVDGEPYSSDPTRECLPENILALSCERELLCVNVLESGRDSAIIKLISRMLSIDFDVLWQRYRREQKKLQNIKIIILLILFLVAFIISLMFYHKNCEISEQNWQMLKIQSSVVAGLAEQLAESGDGFTSSMLALEVLPQDLSSPERPYTPNAERALRKASSVRGGMFKGHALEINDAIVSKDDTCLITASSDRTIKIWNMQTGACINTLYGHKHPVDHIELNRDETLLVSNDYGGVIKVWDYNTFECLSTIEMHRQDSVSSVHVACDDSGKLLRVFVDNSLYVYDALTGDCLLNTVFDEMSPHSTYVWATDKYLLTETFWIRSYELWDIDSQQLVKLYRDLNDVSLSYDKKYVEVIDNKGCLSIYSFETGRCELMLNTDFLKCVISPDMKMVAVEGTDVIYILDIKTQTKIAEIVAPDLGESRILWAHDMKSIITIPNGRGVAKKWEIEYNTQLPYIQNPRFSRMRVKYSHNGEMLSYSIGDTLRVVSIEGNDLLLEIVDEQMSYANFAFSPDDRYFFQSSYQSVVKADSKENHYLNIYDITSSKKIQTLHLQCQVECYAFSNDRRLLAVATRNPLSYCESIEPIYGEEYELACYSQPTGNCYIYICDLQTLSILTCLEGHQGAVTSLVFTEDDSKIVSSSNDCSIAIWDTKNYKKLSMLLGHSEVVHDILLSDDDSGIISCSWDGTIRIWDMASLDCCSVIYAHSQNIVGMPVCENHEYFATLALDGVKIWSVKDLECICSFDPVSQLEFIDGGDYVLASRNGDICMYDLPSGECVMVYEDVGNAFDYNKFNRMVAAAGENGIFLFRIEPLQELIDRTREKYEGRQFTVEERNEYFLENR